MKKNNKRNNKRHTIKLRNDIIFGDDPFMQSKDHFFINEKGEKIKINNFKELQEKLDNTTPVSYNTWHHYRYSLTGEEIRFKMTSKIQELLDLNLPDEEEFIKLKEYSEKQAQERSRKLFSKLRFFNLDNSFNKE
jgi:hypothetical protein